LYFSSNLKNHASYLKNDSEVATVSLCANLVKSVKFKVYSNGEDLKIMGEKYSLLKLFIFLIVIANSGCTSLSTKQEAFPPYIPGFVVINETSHEMKSGDFKWERKIGFTTEVARTDTASPNQIGEKVPPIPVQPNEKVKIKLERNPELKAYLWNESSMEREISLNGNSFIFPNEVGRYIYEVRAVWEDGEVSYTFVVEVK
jgi:hypothetical protein